MTPDDPDDRLAPEWETLLEDGLLEPPPDFTARVMSRVREEAEAATAPTSPARPFAAALEAVAVAFAAAAAGWQTLAFAFGLWATTIAA